MRKKSRTIWFYNNPSAPFGTALTDLVGRCRNHLDTIRDIRATMKKQLDEAAAIHGIDPAAVRRLVAYMQNNNNGDVDRARDEEIDQAYRAIADGGMPATSKRADTELDKVMALVATGSKLPKIDDIMKAVTCSRGKAHKLRTLAAARLAAKSSGSSKTREHELLTVAHNAESNLRPATVN